MIQSEIEQLIQPTVQSLGYELWGCEYLAQGKHSLLRIYIDKPDGIDVKDCEIVSHQVSAILDVDDPIPGNYSLEVSSPGIPRPLFHANQYERYIGLNAYIKLSRPVAGKRKYIGTIVSVNEQTLILNIEQVQQEFLFSNIVKANLTDE
jgi:ribosome maturation factor RimP